jgi:hypothetical protein
MVSEVFTALQSPMNDFLRIATFLWPGPRLAWVGQWWQVVQQVSATGSSQFQLMLSRADYKLLRKESTQVRTIEIYINRESRYSIYQLLFTRRPQPAAVILENAVVGS